MVTVTDNCKLHATVFANLVFAGFLCDDFVNVNKYYIGNRE